MQFFVYIFSLKLLFGMCYDTRMFICCREHVWSLRFPQNVSINYVDPLSSAGRLECRACWAVFILQMEFCSVAVSGFLGTACLLVVRHLECTPWQQVQNLIPSYLKKQNNWYRDMFYMRKKQLAQTFSFL